jgi:aspartyl-tRNA(Asn)/glutamyl-tRNA(Gln) amidotransferase subunit A
MRVSHADLPDHPYETTARTILNGEMAAAHAEFIASKRLDALVDAGQRAGLRKSLALPVAEYARAARQRQEIRRDFLRLLEQYDALLSPSLVGEAAPLDVNLAKLRRKRGGYSVLGALCGIPALSLPMGFGRHGLPLGLSITGNLLDEATVLHVGMIYQRETDWHHRHPPG